jgi:hypothetical protein
VLCDSGRSQQAPPPVLRAGVPDPCGQTFRSPFLFSYVGSSSDPEPGVTGPST